MNKSKYLLYKIFKLIDKIDFKIKQVEALPELHFTILITAFNNNRNFNLPENYLKFIGDRPGQVDLHISSTEKAKELLN